MLRYLTAGESHGPALTAVVEGLPAGMRISASYINEQLKLRQSGYGRGGRMKIEEDKVCILSGLRGGVTLGSPLTMQIKNKDWDNWSSVMAPDEAARTGEKTVTRPRPGHADLAGALKYGHQDMRNVLERASARETAARVAAGSVARQLLRELGIEIAGYVCRIGSVALPVNFLEDVTRSPAEFGAKIGVKKSAGSTSKYASEFEGELSWLRRRLAASEMLCPDAAIEEQMKEQIDRAREEGDSLGGVFEVRAYGLPPGLGSYTHWDRRLDGRLAGALMSVQAIKAVEIGDGVASAVKPGSKVHDEIFYEKSRGFYRLTNRAGGIEGGVSNGEVVVVRGYMKPIPTLRKPLKSVDLFTKQPFEAAVERSDVCAVPAACIVGEAVVAWELARACLEKFGGDTVDEVKHALEYYLSRVPGSERRGGADF